MYSNFKEELSEADWVQVPEDFEPGDTVVLRVANFRGIGSIVESSEEGISIQTENESFYYDVDTIPSVAEVLQSMFKVPDFSLISRGTVMSRIAKEEGGKWYREYATVTDLVRNEEAELTEVTFFIMNGPEDEEVLEIQHRNSMSLQERMAFWQIEG